MVNYILLYKIRRRVKRILKDKIADGELATVSVRDTGVGIAPDVLPHVFDRFRQADASHRQASYSCGCYLLDLPR